MDTLSQHIEYLLQRMPCVILPGMGAFVATASEARIDWERGVAYPPSVAIGFNACIANDDGVMANSYARRMGVSFEAGREALAEDIADMREMLEAEGEIAVGRLGILAMHEDGRLEFTARLTSEQRAAAIGMTCVEFVPRPAEAVERSNSALPAANAESPSAVYEDAEASQISAATTPETMEYAAETADSEPAETPSADRRYVTLRLRRSWLRAVAACLAVAVVSSICWLGVKHAGSVGSVPAVQQAAVVPVPEAKPSQVVAAAPKSAVAATAAESVPERPMLLEPDAEAYYLIVGTFRNLDEAKTFVGQYQSDAWPLTIIKGATVYRVSAAASAESHDLRAIAADPAFSSRFSQPWIWHLGY